MTYELIPQSPNNPYPLGRHLNHDPASKMYPFSARPEAAFSVGPKEWVRRAPIFDQGSLGSCTGNAGEGWEATDDAVRPGDLGKVEADAVQLYSDATRIDPYPGIFPPDDTGSDGLSIAKVLKARGVIDQYTHAFSLDEAKVAIQTTPVMFGSVWYDGMFYPNGNGVVSISGSVVGGHEYLGVGYDADGSLRYPAPWKINNSWGTGWGDHGSFYVSDATMSRLLAEGGDVTVLHAVGGPIPPIPPQPPKPTPSVLKWLEALIAWIKHVLGA